MILSTHQQRVLLLLASRGTMTTPQIAEHLGIPHAVALMLSLFHHDLVKSNGRGNRATWKLSTRGHEVAARLQVDQREGRSA